MPADFKGLVRYVREMTIPVSWFRRAAQYASAIASIALLTAVMHSIENVNDMTVALVYLAAILIFATAFGIGEALTGVLLVLFCLDYYFENPRYHLSVNDPEKAVALVVFLFLAIGGSVMSVRIKRRTMEALARQLELAQANEELEERQREVEHEKSVSEGLLRNILPDRVANELRSKGEVTPRYFEDVTILFTDFVGFTLATEQLAAEDLVHCLHDYFTAFDRIIAKYQMEKLKTIGDSYMCVGGLPARNPANPVDAVMAAIEIVEEVRRRDREDSPARWRVRVGLHTGPVIAGVVGIQKFAFDVWGDTVNYSSRMESTSLPNAVNISERTHARVKDFFECEYRGKVQTKEKKEMDMYFVKGVLPALLRDKGVAIPQEFSRRYRAYFEMEPPAFPEFLVDQARTEVVVTQ